MSDRRDIAISVHAIADSGGIAPAGAHSEITMAENTIVGGPMPQIELTSAVDESIADNWLKASAAGERDPDEKLLLRRGPGSRGLCLIEQPSVMHIHLRRLG